jgi:3-oxoadipate enol-lactonase
MARRRVVVHFVAMNHTPTDVPATPSLAMRISGDGKPVVLLHSLLADGTSFAAFAALLAPYARVAVPDLPGFGGSPSVGTGLAAIADRIAQAWPALTGEGGRPAAVLGNGFGSFVAMTLALRHPHLVSRLVLAGSGARFSDPGRAAFVAMADATRRGGLETIADVAMRRLFAAGFAESRPDLVAACRTRFLATDPAVFLGACAALAGLDLSGEVAAIRVPVLIVVGSDDAATPQTMAELLAGLLPDARLTILDGLAHVPQLQDPVRFLDAVRPFILGAVVS